MGVELTPSVIGRFKHIARSLPASKRSAFQASVALEFCDGSPRLAESTFGWSRRAVQFGIANFETSTVSEYRSIPKPKSRLASSLAEEEREAARTRKR